MLQRITTAGEEPVSVAEAKLAAKIDHDDLDELIAGYISTAREQAEQATKRVYRGGLWRWTGSDWPKRPLELVGECQASVKYWNGAALVALAPSAYVCTASAELPGVAFAPAVGTSLPTLPQIAAGPRVTIELTFAVEPGAVAQAVKTYIKAHVSAWVRAPEALVSSALVSNPLYERLLNEQSTFL